MALPQPAAPASQDRARIVFDCRITSGHYIVGDFAHVYEINHGPHAQKLTRKGLAASLEISSAVIFPEPRKDQYNRRNHLPGYAAWEIHPVMRLDTL